MFQEKRKDLRIRIALKTLTCMFQEKRKDLRFRIALKIQSNPQNVKMVLTL
jgi:hypothetical protein